MDKDVYAKEAAGEIEEQKIVKKVLKQQAAMGTPK